VARARRVSGGAGCLICRQDETYIEVRGQRVFAEFFLCGKVGCRAKSHNECLGFPGVTFAAISAVSPWYCPLHVGLGRLMPLDDEEAQPKASQAKAKVTKTVKDAPRGRGRPPKNPGKK